MGKGAGNQTITTKNELDPATRANLDQFRAASQGQFDKFAGGQMNAATQSFLQNAGLLTGGLATGMQTGLAGISQFTNPHEASVIAGIQGDEQRQLAGVQKSAGDAAQAANAFGGSRAAVLQAAGQRDVRQGAADRIAGVRQQGFQNSVQSLMQERARLGQLGAAGAGMFGQAGRSMDQNTLQALGIFGDASMAGQTGTETSTQPLNKDVLGGAVGGAMAGASFGGPIGGAIGGGIGLLGGLFG